MDRVLALHAGSRGFDSHRGHMSERFFQSNRPGYLHPMNSELENSGSHISEQTVRLCNYRFYKYMYKQSTSNISNTDISKNSLISKNTVKTSVLYCTARQCSPLQRSFLEWPNNIQLIGQSLKTLNFSAFHLSPRGCLVPIGQHFVATRVVHLPKSTETSLITEADLITSYCSYARPAQPGPIYFNFCCLDLLIYRSKFSGARKLTLKRQ